MEMISGQEAARRAVSIISEELKRFDAGEAGRERLEKAVRLWSEGTSAPDRRVEWTEAPSIKETQPQQGAAFDHLPAHDAALKLFDDRGVFREDIREAGVAAVRAHPSACVLMAGGAATRYMDSLSALGAALEAGSLTPEQRDTVELFEKTGLDVREAMGKSKLFAPLGPVTGLSAFEINMASVAAMSALSGRDMPVIVFVSGQTRESVEEILIRHGGWGLKSLAVAMQDDAPVMREDDYTQLQGADGPAVGANGGGGIVYSLGHARPRGLKGELLYDGPIMGWLSSLGVERVIFSQTDDAKTVELYLGLAATAARGRGMAACASAYPTPLVGGDPLTPAFKLGSFWSDGKGGMACREFAELTDDQKRRLTRPDDTGRALANTALYMFDMALLERVIAEGGLKLHLQRHKKVQDTTGAFVPVTKFEYFLPDMPELAARYGMTCSLMLLRDTSDWPSPLTDMTVDALPAKDIGKLALSRLALLARDKKTAENAGLTVEDGALIEIGPFAEIRVQGRAAIKAGAKVYIGGTAENPAVVTFKDGAAVSGERRFTGTETVG